MTAKRLRPYSFVLEELAESSVGARVRTRPMFGALAVYVDAKIVFILRKKEDAQTSRDNGVWMIAMPGHVASLRREFPEARAIEIFQAVAREGFSGWMNLPEDEDGFEEAALRACRMVIDGDPRIGKVPKPKARKRPRT